MSSFDLSIIIVNWNVRDLLAGCLESLQKAMVPYQHEIFVVDNNSSDGSVAMVKDRFPLVNIIANPINMGFGKANNIALCRCTGRYVLMINPDMVIRETAPRILMDFMDACKDAVACSCCLRDPSGGIVPLRMHILRLKDELYRDTIYGKIMGKILSEKSPPVDYTTIHQVEWMPGACILARTNLVKEIGGFDERFFLYAEDDDLCRRLGMLGKMYYIPGANITHLSNKSAEQTGTIALTIGAYARFQYYRKYYGFFALLPVQMAVVISLIISFGIWYCRTGGKSRSLAKYRCSYYLANLKGCLGIGIAQLIRKLSLA
jgi:GT2 family glycosyltransferase